MVNNIFSRWFVIIGISCLLQIQVSAEPRFPSPGEFNRKLADLLEDRSIVSGKTGNGLTYYIKDHENNDDKIMVALIVHAGSILEEDNQLGLAHFVEHMGFNGTEKFPGNEIIDTLKKEGVRFGEDLNALTAYDFTAFHITIPKEKPHLLPLALDVVEQWLGYMTYGPEEIEKEKGVVLEEVRADEQPFPRALMIMRDFLNEGTPYYNRSPGGKLDVIASAPREVIKSFYDTWYKPGISAVAVIGAVDPKKAVEEILSRFQEKIAPDEVAPSHPDYGFPLEPPDRFLFKDIPVDDPAAAFRGTIAFRENIPRDKREYLWEDFALNLAKALANHRFEQIVKQSSYLKSASLSSTPRGRIGVSYSFHFETRPGSFLDGYRELITEIERLRRWGVGPEEFQSVMTEYLNFFQSTPRDNDLWFRNIIYNFVYGDVIADSKALIDFLKEVKQGEFITLEDINARLKTLATHTGIRFAALHPSNQTLPPESEFRDFFISAPSLQLEKKETIKPITSLITPEQVSRIPTGEAVVKKQREGYVIELGNGSKVYYQPLTTTEKKVSLIGRGHNPASEQYTGQAEELFNFSQAGLAFSLVRLGGYDYQRLSTYFNTLSLDMGFSLGQYKKGINLKVPADKLEEGFRAVYLAFTDMSYDPESVSYFKNRVADGINRMKQNDFSYLNRYINELVYPNDEFRLNWDDYDIKYFDPEFSYRIMREGLANIADYTFYLTGDVGIDTVTYLAKKYLASIPAVSPPSLPNLALSGLTAQKDNRTNYQRGKGQSLIVYGWVNESEKKPTLRERVISTLAGEIITAKFFKEIREKESGVYHIVGFFNIQMLSRLRTELKVIFASQPERMEELIGKSRKLIEGLGKGIDPEETETARKTLATTYSDFQNDLSDYASMMFKLNEYGEDPLWGNSAYLQTLKEISGEEVSAFLRKQLQNSVYYQVVQNPQ